MITITITITCSALCFYRELSPIESTTNVIITVRVSHSFWKLVVLRTSSPRDLRVLFAFKGSPNPLCVDVIKIVGGGDDFGNIVLSLSCNKIESNWQSLLNCTCAEFHLTRGQRLQRCTSSNQSLCVLGLWGLKKRASLSIFFCNIRTVYKCVLMGTLIPLFTMYLLFLDCYFQSFRVQTHIKPKGKQFHFFFCRHVPPVCCSVSSIIVWSFWAEL